MSTFSPKLVLKMQQSKTYRSSPYYLIFSFSNVGYNVPRMKGLTPEDRALYQLIEKAYAKGITSPPLHACISYAIVLSIKYEPAFTHVPNTHARVFFQVYGPEIYVPIAIYKQPR